MRTKNLLILILALSMLVSCKKEESETIRGRVVVWGTAQGAGRMDGQPIAGLPVSIYYQRNPNEELDISQQTLYAVSHTDSDGYYHFTTTEFDSDKLRRFNAYSFKSGPFDSTLVEWHYVKDTTLYKHFAPWEGFNDQSNGIQHNYFSDLKGHVSDRNTNGFHLVPSGWVVFKFENQTGTVEVTHLNSKDSFPVTFRSGQIFNGPAFMIAPHRKHSFSVTSSDGVNGEVNLTLKDIYIHNSFAPDSRTGYERIVPDTIRINLDTKTAMRIRAKF
jgi:hypothetical protein